MRGYCLPVEEVEVNEYLLGRKGKNYKQRHPGIFRKLKCAGVMPYDLSVW